MNNIFSDTADKDLKFKRAHGCNLNDKMQEYLKAFNWKSQMIVPYGAPLAELDEKLYKSSF